MRSSVQRSRRVHWLSEITKVAAPPPRLTVSQWADQHRVLSSESSAEPGQWSTARAEYQRGIMDSLNDTTVETTVVMKSAQAGASEIVNNILGYYMAHDPGPILFLQPTLEMAEAYRKDRISPMLRDTPQLAALVEDAKSRDSGNTLLHLQFPGGHLTLAGANSPASLASRPIRVVLADEVDRYPVSAGTEGDPLSLAAKRSVTFHDRRMVMVSTPTVKGASRIEAAYQESDQRRFHVPCPHCDQKQVLEWEQVKFSPEDPDSAAYVCVHCARKWTESDRGSAVRAGEWRASAPFNGAAGFHLSELYSPWRSLAAITQDFLTSKPYPERLRTWVNTSLGQTWEVSAAAVIEPHFLAKRAEDYALGTLPPGVGVVVAAVDVQGDRLELYVWGFGEGEECWLLDRVVLYGDPAGELLWEQLIEQLDRPLTASGGALVVPRAVMVDTGGLHTQVVYGFVRANGVRETPHGMQQILAIKGSKSADSPIIGVPTSQDVSLKGQRISGGVKLWPVGSSTVKSLLYGRLKIETPGHGYVHFSAQLPEDVYQQITAERLITKYVRGFGTLVWELQRGRRNEALDCFVYSYAAAVHLGMRRTTPQEWATCRERLHGAKAGAAPKETAAETPPTPSPPLARSNNPGARWAASPPAGNNFVTGWRR